MGDPAYETQWREAATYMKVLGHPNRLALMARLREPTPISEIELHPGEPTDRQRVLTRQGIRHHLNKLQERGLVQVHAGETAGSSQFRYEADLSGLFRVCEMLGDIATSGQPRVLDEDTIPLAPVRSPQRSHADAEAKLVLVHGVERARAFPLRSSAVNGSRGWVIGSAPGAHVQIDHDPFVETEHCEILPAGDGYRLIDLRVSRSGTWLNWEKLEIGGERTLETGDVVGVGRSLFVFRG